MLNRFFFNATVGLGIFGVAILCAFFEVSAVYAIIAISVFTVVLIIFGDDLELKIFGARNNTETNNSDSNLLWSIAEAFLSREALLPCFLICGLWSTGYVRWENISTATIEKIDIIILILSFAVIAQGIKHSGYFKYAAYRVLEVCDGKINRMTLYLFSLSSVLTFVTSNDIVILVMTPIVLELCKQARIGNARLLLMSQFVAANTLSMGLLIGSPTNIIIASDVGLRFFDYFILMLIPSVFAVISGFLALYLINTLFQKHLQAWQHSDYYSMPALKDQLAFSKEMRGWVSGFAALLVGVAIISHYHLPFFWLTVPAMVIALGALSLSTDESSKVNPLKQCLGKLPYQIFFFALAFFTISEALAEHLSFDEILVLFTSHGHWLNTIYTLAGIGLLVNVINDLPAAAIAGKMAVEASVLTDLDWKIFMQSMLVALNIGCYVTPVGALAGIIWFHILRDSGGVKTPTRLGMITYGLLHFLLVTVILSILIPFTNILIQWLFSTKFITDQEINLLFPIGGMTALVILVCFFLVLKGQKVHLIDLRAFLSAASWISVRSRNSGIAFQIVISLLVITGFIFAIWYTEGDPRSGSNKLETVGDFVVWSIVFLGSGFEDGWFPQTPIAKIISGTMPIFAIFLIIRTMQVVRDDASLADTSRRIARGEITTRRSVVLGYHHYMRPIIRKIWQNRENLNIFQTVLYTNILHH